MDDGWIKVNRKLLRWGWFRDAITLQVWLFLLLSANYHDGEFCGVKIKRGQVVTSYASVARNCGISIRNARTAISHLKSTGEVTSKAYSKFSVFSIVRYEYYQRDRQADCQSGGKQATASKKGKKKEAARPAEEGGPGWEQEIPERFRGRFRSMAAYQAWCDGEEECYQ